MDIIETQEFVHPRAKMNGIAAINHLDLIDHGAKFVPPILNPQSEYNTDAPLRTEVAPGIKYKDLLRQGRPLTFSSHLKIASLLTQEIEDYSNQTGTFILDLNQDNVFVEMDQNSEPSFVWVTDLGLVGDRGKGIRIASQGEVAYMASDRDVEEMCADSIANNLMDLLLNPKGLSEAEVKKLEAFGYKWKAGDKRNLAMLQDLLSDMKDR